MSIRSRRKEEHLALAQMFFNQAKKNSFDYMHLLRPALPEKAVRKQSSKTTMFGKQVAAPFFIEAMTGGSAKSAQINRSLAKIAKREKIALALGSASILVNEPDQLDSFTVARAEDPEGVLLANINPRTPASAAQKIVDVTGADALQIHLNTVQEIAMPEGDRDFRWLDNLRQIRQTLTVPVIIKEVGFGLDPKSMLLLKREGFKLFDLAGSGGTDFAQIENQRNPHDVSYLSDLGLPTVIAAVLAQNAGLDFIVSGGVRNPLDVFKSLVLGAKYVGVANAFLQILQTKGAQQLQKTIAQWKEQLNALLAIFGQDNLQDLTQIRVYFDANLKSQLDQLL